MNKRGKLAITEILILLIGIFAFAWMIGEVSGEIYWIDKRTSKGGIATDKTNVPQTATIFSTQDEWQKEYDKLKSTWSQTDIPTAVGAVSTTKSLGFWGGTQTTYNPNHPLPYVKSYTKILGGDATIGGDTIIKGSSYMMKDGKTLIKLPDETIKTYDGKLLAGADGTTIKGGTGGTGVGSTFWQSPTGSMIKNAGYSLAIYGIVRMVGGMFLKNEQQANSAAMALSLGYFAGSSSATLFPSIAKSWAPWAIGGGVAIAILLLTWKDESTKVVTFECNPWQPAVGGSKCEECNDKDLPCSEYQCRSLGQGCQIVNTGTTDQKCIWNNSRDVKAPVLETWTDALSKDFKYSDDKTVSPPDRGVNIIYTPSTTGCVKAFTPFTFGIKTDEPASCKLDYTRKQKITDMNYYFGGTNAFLIEHKQQLSLPGPTATENGTIIIPKNDQDYSLFVKCIDANGNMNQNEFVFKFCVEKGPDATAPQIVSTSILNGMPVSFGSNQTNIEVYVNEPATCKWAKDKDKDYSEMENTMACASNVLEMNANMVYKCKTTLTGLKNKEENVFFFKCEDQPYMPKNDRNIMSQSYKFSLIGTEPLVIKDSSLKPNETIRDSTEIVKVTLEAETQAGYNKGEAVCSYTGIKDASSEKYIEFFNTHSYKHSTDLNLPSGTYTYYIKCVDLGGNADIKSVSFGVETDTSAPVVVRAYHDESYLKIITNEKASCVYGKDSCSYSFADGIKITSVDDKEHFTDWNTNFNYYIKCEDEFGNSPIQNSCSITARPSNDFK